MGAGLEGRRILVTGGSSGIGAATARAIVADGGRVAIVARGTERVQALADELDGVAVPADVTDIAAIRSGVDVAAGSLHGLDGLVNAAGVLRGGAIATMNPADWQLLFDVNVVGVLNAMQAALPHLRAAPHADIVNISSLSGRRLGSTEMAAYAASKAALHMVSEGARREFRPDGVRVGVVAPGFVRTELFGARDDDLTQQMGERADAVGLAPEDVARVIVELLRAPPHVVHAEVALRSIEQA